jgi:hypothetical protein
MKHDADLTAPIPDHLGRGDPRLYLRQALARDVRLLPLFRFFASADGDRWPRSSTGICIDGFPRSGNSWAVATFRKWNPNVLISHHLHAPGPVIAALKQRIPTAVLIRDPADAVASYLIYRRGAISVRCALAAYISFYLPLMRYRDKFVLCPFDDVIADPRSIVSRVNSQFGTNFHCSPLDAQSRSEVQDEIKSRGRALGVDLRYQAAAPQAERVALAREVKRQVVANSLYVRAQVTYREIAAP